MNTITKISAMAFICALSMQGHAVTLKYDKYGAIWSAVDALPDTEYDQILHEIKMGDTLPGTSNFKNQSLANGISGILRASNSAFGGDVFDAIKKTDDADEKCAEARHTLKKIEEYEADLKEACARDPDCNAKYNNGGDINVDDISDEDRYQFIRDDQLQTFFPKKTKEEYQKKLDDNQPKTWDAVSSKIRDIVKKDEYLTNPEYTNGMDLVDMIHPGAELLMKDPMSNITNKDEAFDYYFETFQKALDKDPNGFQQQINNLEGYNVNLKNLHMYDDTHRDYLAAVAATIASERQAFAPGLDDQKTID